MKYCLKCGTALDDEVLQCPICGFAEPGKVETPAVMAENPAAEETSASVEIPVSSETSAPIEAFALAENPAPTENPAPEEIFEQTYSAQEENLISEEQSAPTYSLENAEEKPKKKKAWLWIVLAVVLVLAIAAAVWFFFLRPEEEQKSNEEILFEAIEKSSDELDELYAEAENLGDLFNVIASFDTAKASVAVSTEMVQSGVTVDFSVQANASENTSIVDGEILFGIETGVNKASFHINYSVDGETIQFSAPDLVDEVYCVNLEELGILDSTIMDALEQEQTALSEEDAKKLLDELWDSIVVDAVSEESFLLGAEEAVCKVYAISYDAEIVTELFDGMNLETLATEETTTLDPDSIQNIRLLVRDEVCIGLLADVEYDDAVMEVKILLAGAQNPWEEVYFYVDEEEKAFIYTEQTEDGFVLEIVADDTAAQLRITCNDDEQMLLIEDRAGYIEDITISYQVEEDGLILTIKNGASDSPIAMRISQLEKEPEMLSDDAIDLTQMDELQQSYLLISILQALRDNPETAWIVDMLMEESAMSVQ